MRTARRYTITAAALLTALLALPAGAQDPPAIANGRGGPPPARTQPPDLNPAGCSNGTYVADPANAGLVADCRALVSIRNHWTRLTVTTTSGLLTWGTGGTAAITDWKGIGINGQRVATLDLSNDELIGPIPAEIGQLTNLTELNLSRNKVYNHDTDLYDNGLTGPIPAEIGQLTNLTNLNLYRNKLTGPIPAELGQLTNLEYLHLSDNELTAIPAEISQLTNLKNLHLNDNQLTGTIPAELGNLTNLNELLLYRNKLTGQIPAELGQLTNLNELLLYRNKLTGTIPAELGQLTNLEYLHLSDNELTAIPAEISQLTNLKNLHLNDNQLTGTIPAELGNLTNLNELLLYRNKLTGQIPAELGQLTNITNLNLSGNQLTGTIPAELAQLTNLGRWGRLYLGGNELTGTVPAGLEQQLTYQLTELGCPVLFTGGFCDDDNSGHESSIETITGWGITQGCDPWNPRYCPGDSITRRQMAAFLHRAVTHRTGTEPPAPADPAVLTDVEEGSSSLAYIQWAVAAGVMQAPEGVFNPRGTVTRADMAEMMAAAFDHITPPAAAAGIFTDMAGQPDAAIRAAEALRTAGVTAGCSASPLRYCPDQPVNRAWMAAFFARALS